MEVVFLTYLLSSAFFIVLFRDQLQLWTGQIMIRALVLFLVAFLVLLNQTRVVAFLRIFLPFFFLSYFYSETALFHDLTFTEVLDQHFASMDQFIFGGQPSIYFSKNWNSPVFSELMFFGYFSYYLMIVLVPVYIYFTQSKEIGEKIPFIIINSLLVYYLIFSFFPVVGPQYYFSKELINVPGGYVFEPLIRMIQQVAERPTGAFPSSHVSLCLMLVWMCYLYARKWIFLVVPVAALLILSTVYIAAHYAIDVIGGILFTPIIYLFSAMLYDLLSKYHLNVVKSWK